jgi:hypothetical protein
LCSVSMAPCPRAWRGPIRGRRVRMAIRGPRTEVWRSFRRTADAYLRSIQGRSLVRQAKERALDFRQPSQRVTRKAAHGLTTHPDAVARRPGIALSLRQRGALHRGAGIRDGLVECGGKGCNP